MTDGDLLNKMADHLERNDVLRLTEYEVKWLRRIARRVDRPRQYDLEIRRDAPVKGQAEGDIDEIVVHNPSLLHFERMSDQGIWIGINNGRKITHVRIGVHPQSKSKLYFQCEENV